MRFLILLVILVTFHFSLATTNDDFSITLKPAKPSSKSIKTVTKKEAAKKAIDQATVTKVDDGDEEATQDISTTPIKSEDITPPQPIKQTQKLKAEPVHTEAVAATTEATDSEERGEAKAEAKEEVKAETKTAPVKLKAVTKAPAKSTKAAAAKEKSQEKSQDKTKAAIAAIAAITKDGGESVSAEKSLGWLKNGNTRYIKGFLRKDGQSKADIQRLSSAQKPHAIILSCSDSRVPPEIVFDQKLGEIFVIRTAGEALDDNVIGSIEYAVEHLGSHLLVVMGHESCGAVKAALQTLDGSDAGSPALNALVKDLQPRLQSFKGKDPSANIIQESWANVKGVARDVILRSKIIAEKVKSGELQIQQAMYHMENGFVEFGAQMEIKE